MRYLLEVDAYDPVIAGVRTLRYGTDGVMTRPNDVPANTFYEPRLNQPGNFERSIFGSGGTTGAGSSSFGDMVLANIDGKLDPLNGMAFDGRLTRLYALPEDAPFSARMVLFSGTIEQAEVSEQQVTFRLRDRLEELNKDLQTVRYLGTTTAGGQGTAEGTENDIKDRPKPLIFGRVFEVPLVTVNPFDNLFQGAHNAVSSCDAVYVAALPLTRVEAIQTTIAGLMSVTLAQGQYAVMLSPFIVRIGGGVSGVVTADVTEGATAADRTTAQLVKRILAYAGKVEGIDFLTSDLAAFDAAQPAEQGVFCPAQDMQIRTPIDLLLAGVSGYITDDRLGRFRIGRFDAPFGQPDRTLGDIEILDDGQAIETLATSDQGKGVPAAKVTQSHTYLWYVHDESSMAGAVSVARRAYLKEQSRTAVAEDASVRVRHLLASEMTFSSLLTSAATASAEANRKLGLYKIRRDLVAIKIPLTEFGSLDFGDVVEIVLDRLGFQNGKLLAPLRFVVDLDPNTIETVTIELWG